MYAAVLNITRAEHFIPRCFNHFQRSELKCRKDSNRSLFWKAHVEAVGQRVDSTARLKASTYFQHMGKSRAVDWQKYREQVSGVYSESEEIQ